MALKKQIKLDNGVTTNYHRIVSINKITNVGNVIEVASYTSQNKREEEREAIENKEAMNIFINTEVIQKEYNETDTIEDTYSYIKTLDKYKDAEDV